MIELPEVIDKLKVRMITFDEEYSFVYNHEHEEELASFFYYISHFVININSKKILSDRWHKMPPAFENTIDNIENTFEYFTSCKIGEGYRVFKEGEIYLFKFKVKYGIEDCDRHEWNLISKTRFRNSLEQYYKQEQERFVDIFNEPY